MDPSSLDHEDLPKIIGTPHLASNQSTVERFEGALERSRGSMARSTSTRSCAFIPGLMGLDPALADWIALGTWPSGMPSEQPLASLYDASVRFGLPDGALLM
jgi:hypothetical protein